MTRDDNKKESEPSMTELNNRLKAMTASVRAMNQRYADEQAITEERVEALIRLLRSKQPTPASETVNDK